MSKSPLLQKRAALGVMKNMLKKGGNLLNKTAQLLTRPGKSANTTGNAIYQHGDAASSFAKRADLLKNYHSPNVGLTVNKKSGHILNSIEDQAITGEFHGMRKSQKDMIKNARKSISTELDKF
tara:strand:- start:1522 stop:1890 length:369 start_codon:yes stop_codon:yes gene_type:complete